MPLFGIRGNKSIQVSDLFEPCVTPQFLKIVELTDFREEHMNERGAIINDYPLRVLISIVVIWFLARLFLDIFPDIIGY